MVCSPRRPAGVRPRPARLRPAPRKLVAGAALLLLAGCLRGPRPPVLVVGGGPAGMAAALEAAACAEVTLVEGRDRLGGSAAWGDAVTALPSAAALAALDEAAGHPNPARARYAERVGPDVVDWLGGLGVRWRTLPMAGEQGTELRQPEGGGAALVGSLEKAVRAAGVTVRLGERVSGLAALPEGGRWTAAGGGAWQSVVVATGGFAGDLARVRDRLSLPPEVPLLRGGPAFADGNGLDQLVALGGRERRPADVVLYAHGLPAGPGEDRALMFVDGAHAFPVDREGRYFAAAQVPRGDSGRALLGLPGATAWMVVDQKAIEHIPVWDPEQIRYVPLAPVLARVGVEAPDLPALAGKLGVPEAALQAGVAPRAREARPERPLLQGARWGALPLQVTAAKTLSGVETDLDGRVLDAAGAPLPGLYAAGEVAGFGHPWEGAHLDSSMVAGAVLTGRVAGRAVCGDL